MELFHGNHEKCVELDRKICSKMGFESSYYVSGQTYTRKIDSIVVDVLAGIAQSCHKFSNDLRLLQHLKEIEEPKEPGQIGSSAMAYKRNPMRSERMASLSRYVISVSSSPMMTASEQWFERTLDDSANKRISVPEAFLAIDSVLGIYANIAGGMIVYDKMITRHIMDEIPFMATENIMMDCVERGGDRQELHEKIRKLSLEAGRVVKEEGKPNNMLELIANDSSFGLDMNRLNELTNPSLYTGRSAEQVESFLDECVRPVLAAHSKDLEVKSVELKV